VNLADTIPKLPITITIRTRDALSSDTPRVRKPPMKWATVVEVAVRIGWRDEPISSTGNLVRVRE
jgi:hypothetical protein